MTFWLVSPAAIIDNFSLLPTANATLDENLNAITRLLIIVAFIIALLGVKWWGWFLVACLLIIIAIWKIYSIQKTDIVVSRPINIGLYGAAHPKPKYNYSSGVNKIPTSHIPYVNEYRKDTASMIYM